MLIEAITFIVAIIFLVKGSDFFVQAASDIATKLGASQLVVGLTIVAVGTSIPELAASISASMQHAPAIIIGNIVGSNIANICLIGGVAVIIHAATTHKRILMRDGYTMLFAAGILYIMSIDGRISFVDGIILFILYAAYILFLLETRSEEDEQEYHFKQFFEYVLAFKYVNSIGRHAKNILTQEKRSAPKKAMLRDAAIIVISGTAIFFGAQYTIKEAIYFASIFGLPQSIVGVTLVAIGTSLPELSVAIAAARKGFGEIILGNIIGSNIANVLLIGGVSAWFGDIPIGRSSLLFTIPVMLFTTVLFLFFMHTKWKLSRWEGASLLVLYAVFLVTITLHPMWAG